MVDRANQVLRKISHGTVSTYTVSDGYSLYIPSGNPFPFDFGGPFGGGVLIEPPGGGCGGNEYGRGMFVASSGGQQIALVFGSLLVADSGNHTIRRIAADGTVTTIAGVAGVAGSDDGPARTAHLNTPSAFICLLP